MKPNSFRLFSLATVVTSAVVGFGALATPPLVLADQPLNTAPQRAVSAAQVKAPAQTSTQTSGGSGASVSDRSAPLSRGLSGAVDSDAPARTVESEMRAAAPQALAPRSAPIEPVPPPEFSFEIATHNVLGASHTSGKGRRGFAGAETRMGYTVGLLNGYGVDVVGFQELQSSQYHMFSGRMPGFGVYPGPAAGPLGYENSIAWRESMFSLVDSYTIGVPYFGGRIRPMPVIRLKEETTGREFFVANFHNPADTHGAAGHWRAAATSIQIGLINRLQEESGLPVFITGDMNERESYFCRVTASTGIASASGGGTGSPCLAPPGPVPVDWILATTDVEITAFHDVRTGIITRTSDHPLLVATALLAQ